MSSFLQPKSQNKNAPCVYYLLRSGHFAQAYTLIKPYADSKDFIALFGLGICYSSAEDFEKAAMFFEKALLAAKSSGLATALTERSEIYITLRKKEIADKVYLKPVKSDFYDKFPEAVRENTTMALVETLIKCAQKDKAKQFAAMLSGEEFTDFKGECRFGIL